MVLHVINATEALFAERTLVIALLQMHGLNVSLAVPLERKSSRTVWAAKASFLVLKEADSP